MVLNTVDHIDELELAGFDKAKDLGMRCQLSSDPEENSR